MLSYVASGITTLHSTAVATSATLTWYSNNKV